MVTETRENARSWRRAVVWPAIALALLIGGCSKGATVDSFRPQDEPAQVALDATLAKWKEGGACEPFDVSELNVKPYDSEWSGGKKITAYEIVGVDAESSETAKKFNVKLTMDGAAKETSYYVVGKGQDLHVFRDKDYDSLSGSGGQ